MVVHTAAELNILGTFLRLMDESSEDPEIFLVSSRDINQILREHPDIVPKFRSAFSFDFFDLVEMTVYDSGGNAVDFPEPVRLNFSATYFLPNKGRLYLMEDVESSIDEEERFFRDTMLQFKVGGCFLTKSKKLYPFDSKYGCRVIKESEIVAIDLNEPLPN